MRLIVSQHNVGVWAAYYLYKKITAFNPTSTKPFVLGLPTGSTPLAMYEQLIKLHKNKLLSFKNVITFNMDEYVGLEQTNSESYHHYMYHNFFNHIDIEHKNIHILNGMATNLIQECQNFEQKITDLGGMEIIVGGLGEDGHLAFNEPGSSLASVTRVKTLNSSTVMANSRFFGHNIEKTPTLALTMGMKTIMDAKEVMMLAKGMNKAVAIAHTIEGAVSGLCPASFLQMHPKASIICDAYAAYELKVKTVRYFENISDEFDAIEKELIKAIII
jgi:glucosamine-6-phosphate deaminase